MKNGKYTIKICCIFQQTDRISIYFFFFESAETFESRKMKRESDTKARLLKRKNAKKMSDMHFSY